AREPAPRRRGRRGGPTPEDRGSRLVRPAPAARRRQREPPRSFLAPSRELAAGHAARVLQLPARSLPPGDGRAFLRRRPLGRRLDRGPARPPRPPVPVAAPPRGRHLPPDGVAPRSTPVSPRQAGASGQGGLPRTRARLPHPRGRRSLSRAGFPGPRPPRR